jgi:hypothetical protein
MKRFDMKRIILGLVLSMLAFPALAQETRVVTNCKGLSPAFDVGTPNVPMTVQPDGTLCIGGGSTTITTGQVSCGTSSTPLVAARAGRSRVKITMNGAVDAFIGVTGVTVATGDLLVGTKGTAMTIETSAALFCVAASAVTVSYLETY